MSEPSLRTPGPFLRGLHWPEDTRCARCGVEHDEHRRTLEGVRLCEGKPTTTPRDALWRIIADALCDLRRGGPDQPGGRAIEVEADYVRLRLADAGIPPLTDHEAAGWREPRRDPLCRCGAPLSQHGVDDAPTCPDDFTRYKEAGDV